MKRLLMLAPLAALLIGSATAAPMGSASGGMTAQGSTDPYKQLRKQHALIAIRDEALKQQAADGGKLTEAHRAELQRKIDAVRAGNY